MAAYQGDLVSINVLDPRITFFHDSISLRTDGVKVTHARCGVEVVEKRQKGFNPMTVERTAAGSMALVIAFKCCVCVKQTGAAKDK